jgi:hypothetical protein
MPTDVGRPVELEDGSSSSSDPAAGDVSGCPSDERSRRTEPTALELVIVERA